MPYKKGAIQKWKLEGRDQTRIWTKECPAADLFTGDPFASSPPRNIIIA
jgi:hypothetical protein